MVFFEALGHKVLHPSQYKNNPLYGKQAMELTAECPTEKLKEIIETPMGLGHCSARQANRMTIVACNAALELDYRENGTECKIPEDLQERIIKTAVKLLKKDLPIRAKAVIQLYTRTLLATGKFDA